MSNYKTINISLPEDLLNKIDVAANADFANRSDYIRESLVRRLKHQKIVDEWGDEGEWETIVNFKSISSSGVAIDDVINAIKQIG